MNTSTKPASVKLSPTEAALLLEKFDGRDRLGERARRWEAYDKLRAKGLLPPCAELRPDGSYAPLRPTEAGCAIARNLLAAEEDAARVAQRAAWAAEVLAADRADEEQAAKLAAYRARNAKIAAWHKAQLASEAAS